MLRVKLGKDNSTMTSEQINEIMQDIIVELNKKCGAEIREQKYYKNISINYRF